MMTIDESIKFSAYESNEQLWKMSSEAWTRYLSFMKDMSNSLNVYHGLNVSSRFWKLTVGKWVQYFIGTLYTNYDLLSTKHDINEDYFWENNYSRGENFRSISFDDTFFELLAKYISFYRNNYSTLSPLKEMSVEYTGLDYNGDLGFDYCCLKKSLISDDFEYLMTKENWFILNKVIDNKDAEIVYPIENSELGLEYQFDYKARLNCFARSFNDEFDYVFKMFVVWNLPFYYFEVFNEVCKKSNNLYPKVKFERVYVADPTDYYSICRDVYIANQVEVYKAKQICVQHGGGYGMSPATKYFYDNDVSDTFLTYGWGGKKFSHICNILLLRNPRYKHNYKSNRILLISTWELKHRIRPIGFSSSIGYREDIVTFLNSMLDDSCILMEWRTFTPRLNVHDGLKKYVLEKTGKLSRRLEIDVQGNAMQRIQQSKLVVLDHLSTTVLETIGAGIPTVMFWRPENTPLTKEADIICKKLRKVGMLHDNPEMAADFIKNINSNVEGWWNSEPVIKVRTDFNNHFSNTSENVLGELINLFNGENCREYEIVPSVEKSISIINEWDEKFYPYKDINSIDDLMGRRLFIFGAGNIGKKAFKALKEKGFECEAFLDNSKDKQGTKIENLKVVSISEYTHGSTDNDIIIISILNGEFEIKKLLINNNISNFISIWQLPIL